ncbi:hypothetical protein NDI76_07185 [Halogeometricum sp. S1BR25-6]|uniref:Uncharacterized protein n=1 Tax=Halogeometricum salsisoli TaxID=2950536 RepID=A0ABU2GCI2_9EURY|nr:hypothetical protein [Halogeometricum sp. S1BR25-6]MDS0298520.1 hypothetical protein [Halogeometricum sp. S1BR25-6]
MDDSEPLTPDELDFRRDPSVTALSDGRYVVATARDAATTAGDRTRRGRRETRTLAQTDDQQRSADSTATETEAESEAGGSEEKEKEKEERPDYFVSLAARTDEGTFETRVADDDIGAVCAAMLRWYARRVAPEDDPAEVLSVLLARSEFSFTAPTADR